MNRNTTMKTANGLALVVLAMLFLSLRTISANDQAAPDTAKWKCKFCVFEEEGRSALLDFGLGYVSSDSYKYGEYNGLEQKGVYLIGNATGRYRGEDAAYIDVSVTDLGLDTRSLGVTGGKQGRYKLFLQYAELPHNISDTSQTPFSGAAGGSCSYAYRCTASRRSLHATQTPRPGRVTDPRDTLGSMTSSSVHETKDGQRATAGSFMISAAQLVQPVDYTTDQVDVSAAYNGGKLQAKLAYYGSLFKNGDDR